MFFSGLSGPTLSHIFYVKGFSRGAIFFSFRLFYFYCHINSNEEAPLFGISGPVQLTFFSVGLFSQTLADPRIVFACWRLATVQRWKLVNFTSLYTISYVPGPNLRSLAVKNITYNPFTLKLDIQGSMLRHSSFTHEMLPSGCLSVNGWVVLWRECKLDRSLSWTSCWELWLNKDR